MTVIKGLLLGGILTWVFSLVLGHNGQRGSYLNIHAMPIYHHVEVYWSWPLFIAASIIASALMAMMEA